ncbi:MAG: DUF2934 domain-containing protein [Candidatus Korobacteraceae bacterium]
MPTAKRTRSATTVKSKRTTGKTDSPVLANREEVIRARAYQLYAERGFMDGFAQDDWLRAEAEVTSQERRT